MKYSKLPRIYAAECLEENRTFPFDLENYNYLKNVMRLKDGFSIRVYNERDGEYNAQVKFDSRSGSFKIGEKLREPYAQQIETWLFAAIIKSDKFELICDMATQMGVTKIVPIISERVQKREVNEARLKKIIMEAARQSERLDSPQLFSPLDLKDLKNTECSEIFFANEMEQNEEVLNVNSNNIGVLIGPEGGFTEEEIKFLNNLDFVHSVSLGQNVLRAETAAISMLARVI